MVYKEEAFLRTFDKNITIRERNVIRDVFLRVPLAIRQYIYSALYLGCQQYTFEKIKRNNNLQTR